MGHDLVKIRVERYTRTIDDYDNDSDTGDVEETDVGQDAYIEFTRNMTPVQRRRLGILEWYEVEDYGENEGYTFGDTPNETDLFIIDDDEFDEYEHVLRLELLDSVGHFNNIEDDDDAREMEQERLLNMTFEDFRNFIETNYRIGG